MEMTQPTGVTELACFFCLFFFLKSCFVFERGSGGGAVEAAFVGRQFLR